MPTWPRCASRGRDFLEGLVDLAGLVVLVLAVRTRPILQRVGMRRRVTGNAACLLVLVGMRAGGKGMPWWERVDEEK